MNARPTPCRFSLHTSMGRLAIKDRKYKCPFLQFARIFHTHEGRGQTNMPRAPIMPVIRLTEVFRQAATSRFVRAAHQINQGNRA